MTLVIVTTGRASLLVDCRIHEQRHLSVKQVVTAGHNTGRIAVRDSNFSNLIGKWREISLLESVITFNRQLTSITSTNCAVS